MSRLLDIPGVIVAHPGPRRCGAPSGATSTLNARLPKHELRTLRLKCTACGEHHTIALPPDVRMRGEIAGAPCPSCGQTVVLTAKRVA